MNPKILPTYFQERAGVLRVGELLNNAGLIFRETPNADVGIDGYIEQVNPIGEATGATVAVQIKSGVSYLIDGGANWKYYPADKHKSYWEMYPLPVILVLHDPESDLVYWADVRQQLRSDQRIPSPLLIPKSALLTDSSVELLFSTAGSVGVGTMSIDKCLRSMAMTRNQDESFPLSYLHLFLEGLTDIGRKLFFSAGMCWDLAELAIQDDTPGGVGMGSNEQDFLDSYLRFLVEQSLAHIDYSDVLVDLEHRQMFPTLLVPLTSRGRQLRDLCRTVGSIGSVYEITEANVGLTDRITNASRTLANFAVASKVLQYFGDAVLRDFPEKNAAKVVRKYMDRTAKKTADQVSELFRHEPERRDQEQ